MNALILAAGTGSRLVNLTRDLPKALVEVNGRPLIDYTLQFVRSLNCDKIVVVGGFYFEKLRDYLKKHDSLTIMENKEFLKGSILTLNSGLHEIEDDFVLLNADHIFPLRLGKRFLEVRGKIEHVTAFVDFDRPLYEDDMKVLLKDVNDVKKISKGLHDFDAGYIGITYVPEKRLKLYKDIARQVQNENENAAVEVVLQRLVDRNEHLRTIDVSGIRWLEVDNLWDFQNAERILKWVSGYLE